MKNNIIIVEVIIVKYKYIIENFFQNYLIC